MNACHCGISGFYFGRDAPGILQVVLSCFGSADVPGGSQQQPDSQALLQRGNGSRYYGCRQRKPACGGSETFFFGYGNKYCEQLQSIHFDYSSIGNSLLISSAI